MAAGATYTPIATTTLGSAAANIEFTSIPSTYTDLILVVTPAQSSPAGDSPLLRVGNGSADSSSIYSYTVLRGTGSAASSYRDTGLTYIPDSLTGMSTTLGQLTITYQIMNYANNTTYKTILVRDNSNTTSYPGVTAIVGLWRSTSAINVVRFYGAGSNLASGTTATLYGIKAA